MGNSTWWEELIRKFACIVRGANEKTMAGRNVEDVGRRCDVEGEVKVKSWP